MDLSDRTKVILAVAVVLVLLYVYVSRSRKEPIQNEGSLSYDADEAIKNIEDPETDQAPKRAYQRSSYRDGRRTSNSDELDRFFEDGNVDEIQSNDEFSGIESGSRLASYRSGGDRRVSEEDKFDAGALLPQERNDDFFEDVQAVSVKNRHLINIYRPIGVNTVSTTLRNASHDIRGEPANPKNFVSPWGNSSIEPGNNIIGLCNK
jgi:hypothetical protein